MESVWNESVSLPRYSRLRGNIKTDVLIIGGGLSGILCSYLLKEKGVESVILESRNICGGITKNTTAKITSQHGLIYNELIKKFDVEKARMYLEANENAVNKYRKLCENIDCDFENKDNFVYSLDNKAKLEMEISALTCMGYKGVSFVEDLPLPMRTVGAVRFSNQAQFNPLKFVSGIIKNLRIYENSPVLELVDNVAVTRFGKVKAEKIIVATHFPFINKHGLYFLKMYQQRSYVLGIENAQNVDGMYIDEEENGLSFRNYKNLLLLGGGGHRTGKQGGSYGELKEVTKCHYPDAKIKYKWATQDCMTLDKVPYIGRYSKTTEDMYVITGFNKWGMTSSMVGAEILSDEICGKKNPYAEVFSPQRTILRPQLAINAVEATINLLTPTAKRCPHLGCALKWNKFEHTWDCPCHGSRFTEEGKLIDNPATNNLKDYENKK